MNADKKMTINTIELIMMICNYRSKLRKGIKYGAGSY
jgi:hypothetical protein